MRFTGTNGTVAIQFPIVKKQLLFQGRFGDTISDTDGESAARICAINVIKQIVAYVPGPLFVGLNHVQVMYQCNDGWDDGAHIADAASQLFNEVLEEKGKHTRSIFGVANLPRNFCIGVVATFTVNV